MEELARQEADGNFICVALEVSKHSSARAIHFESVERHEITQRSQ